MIYFDNNATMPMLPEAREAWLRVSVELIGNPSSLHRAGSRAEAAMEEARRELSVVLGCSPAEIIWTSGATESNNIVLNDARKNNSGEIWVSAIEHPSVLAPAQSAGNCVLIPVIQNGVVDLNWIEERLRKTKPALVAVMAVNNETGIIQPWELAQDLCTRHGVAFLCDATQMIGKMECAGIGKTGFVSGCAHKFGGPKGAGFLKVPSLAITPWIRGGEQESGLRAGTENVPGIISMVAGLKAALGRIKDQIVWRDNFEHGLARNISGVEILGKENKRIWNTSAVIMPHKNCKARWVVKLDRHGFAASTGSACASGKEKPSHVLSAMGISSERASHALRFSSGWETSEEDWNKLLQCLCEVAKEELS